jgi:hypothetical protein
MGFLNPFLYQRGFKGLNDIIEGNVTPRGCNTTGFPVGKGWDPATGLGSPVSRFVCSDVSKITPLITSQDFEKLSKLAISDWL